MNAESDPRSLSSKGWKHKFVTILLYLAIAPAALVAAASFFGRFHWVLDLLSHFRFQYTWWFALWAIVAIITKRRDAAVLACVFTVLNLVPLSHYYPPPFSETAPKSDFRVLSFNLLQDNKQKKETLDWVKAQKADLILLQEFSPSWRKTFLPLKEQYPHQYLNSGHWNYGFAIFSKFPISDKKVLRPTTSRASCLTATVLFKKQPIKLFLVHPVSPDTKAEFHFRNEYLTNLLPEVKKVQLPVIVAGDFNSTVFSPFLKQFSKDLGLKDTAKDRGYHPTYQLHHPIFGIPIDHILHSPQLKSTTHQVGPHLGSDHKPVIAEFTFKR